jgi:signal transduction histidine kinase
MMLVVTIITGAGLYFAERKVETDAERADQAAHESEVAAAQRIHELRRTALTERCRALVRRPRIHAALEDNALDLLYPSAHDEMLDVMELVDSSASHTYELHATFYRFLDADGQVIKPPKDAAVGELSEMEEAQLTLPAVTTSPQLGYLRRTSEVNEVVAAPIISTETNEIIASLVLGFKPMDSKSLNGVWSGDHLTFPDLEPATSQQVEQQLKPAVGRQSSLEIQIGAEPYRAFLTLLNPDSAFPPAYDIACFPLGASLEKQRQVRWQIISAGTALLIIGLTVSHFLSTKLSRPVEQLALVSEVNRTERERAEAELEFTSVELQRSTRFSADASHQLKTPVTVLRAGLEELLQSPDLNVAHREEISQLIFQTSRLTSMIHDLLLLSRLDGGRMELAMEQVDLSQLLDTLADDLSAVPNAEDFHLEITVPRDLKILGEQRYTSIILQNLLENAWKYNQPDGRITITARAEGAYLILAVGNTGRGIPPEAQEGIFERFHRGSVGENVPGHGLGLNLARELAKLHGGDLRLESSTPSWTEFSVRFRLA